MIQVFNLMRFAPWRIWRNYLKYRRDKWIMNSLESLTLQWTIFSSKNWFANQVSLMIKNFFGPNNHFTLLISSFNLIDFKKDILISFLIILTFEIWLEKREYWFKTFKKHLLRKIVSKRKWRIFLKKTQNEKLPIII